MRGVSPPPRPLPCISPNRGSMAIMPPPGKLRTRSETPAPSERKFSPQDRRKLVIEFVSSSSLLSRGTVNTALVPLRMARKLDRNRDIGRMALEPWVVEMALDRLGDRRPTLLEQQRVLWGQPEPRRRSAGRIGGRHSPRLATILCRPPRGRSHLGTNRQYDCRHNDVSHPHNLKGDGSNPTPATKLTPLTQ